MIFNTRFSYPKATTKIIGDSLTDQQFKQECDITSMLKRFGIGNLPRRLDGSYGDFSSVGDFQTSLERVRSAQSDFAALPSSIRDKFNGSLERFMAYVLNPSNIDECVRLGILSRKATSEADKIVDAISKLSPVRAEVAPSTSGNAPLT